jgi:hypothetical protein
MKKNSDGTKITIFKRAPSGIPNAERTVRAGNGQIMLGLPAENAPTQAGIIKLRPTNSVVSQAFLALSKKSLFLWMRHVFGFDQGVEFFGGEEAELDGGFAQAFVVLVGGFGDFGGVVVADFGG